MQHIVEILAAIAGAIVGAMASAIAGSVVSTKGGGVGGAQAKAIAAAAEAIGDFHLSLLDFWYFISSHDIIPDVPKFLSSKSSGVHVLCDLFRILNGLGFSTWHQVLASPN